MGEVTTQTGRLNLPVQVVNNPPAGILFVAFVGSKQEAGDRPVFLAPLIGGESDLSGGP
jgi:hypothetical protein